MSHKFQRTFIILVVFIVSLLVMVTPTLAASATWSGRLAAGDLIWDRVGDCTTPTSGNNEWYDVQSFSVDTAGTYTIEVIDTNNFDDLDTFYALYSGSFNAASPTTNCIGTDDDGDGGGPNGYWSQLDVNLQAGTQYVLVTTQCCDGTTPSEEGNYTNRITGPGNIFLFGTDEFNPGDARVNRAGIDRAAPVTVYCEEDGILILNVDPATGKGVDPAAIHISNDEIDAVGVPTGSNVLLAQGRGVSLYRLTTGEFQVNTQYLNEFKWYIFVWDQCPPTKSYHLAN